MGERRFDIRHAGLGVADAAAEHDGQQGGAPIRRAHGHADLLDARHTAEGMDSQEDNV